MGEFELIDRYFKRPVQRNALGIGDDCALLQPKAGMHLAISTDMLVAGRHFFPDADPHDLGHKALAVNLSDLAACGAEPLAFTLALALPQADPSWLAPFSQGLLALAEAHDCNLIGGDTTRGPLNICITVFGEVPPAQALLRSAARWPSLPAFTRSRKQSITTRFNAHKAARPTCTQNPRKTPKRSTRCTRI